MRTLQHVVNHTLLFIHFNQQLSTHNIKVAVFTLQHVYTELCNTVHYDQLLMMNDSIVRNM